MSTDFFLPLYIHNVLWASDGKLAHVIQKVYCKRKTKYMSTISKSECDIHQLPYVHIFNLHFLHTVTRCDFSLNGKLWLCHDGRRMDVSVSLWKWLWMEENKHGRTCFVWIQLPLPPVVVWSYDPFIQTATRESHTNPNESKSKSCFVIKSFNILKCLNWRKHKNSLRKQNKSWRKRCH